MVVHKKSLLLSVLLMLVGCQEVTVEPLQEQGRALCRSDYQLCVDPILHTDINNNGLSCSASGCHNPASGSGGGFKVFVSPAAVSTQMESNFVAAQAFANLDQPVNSKLLLEPLQGISAISGTHTGGDIFPNKNDLCYQAVLSWITTRVEQQDSPRCGQCQPVELSRCGF
ncbi:MAG: hypothetical protein Q9O24_07100 [Gammaproteobacteria bacterium]|nr:hypothetical protein [Gammaproteobacteria bacterium]